MGVTTALVTTVCFLGRDDNRVVSLRKAVGLHVLLGGLIHVLIFESSELPCVLVFICSSKHSASGKHLPLRIFLSRMRGNTLLPSKIFL